MQNDPRIILFEANDREIALRLDTFIGVIRMKEKLAFINSNDMELCYTLKSEEEAEKVFRDILGDSAEKLPKPGSHTPTKMTPFANCAPPPDAFPIIVRLESGDDLLVSSVSALGALNLTIPEPRVVNTVPCWISVNGKRVNNAVWRSGVPAMFDYPIEVTTVANGARLLQSTLVVRTLQAFEALPHTEANIYWRRDDWDTRRKCCERDHDGDGNCDRHPAK